MRKRDGSVLGYQYDNLNRMTRKIVPERSGLDPSYTRDVYYGYDLRDQQLYARFDSASGPGIVNVYDAFGRLASTTTNVVGGARTLAYQYDSGGRRIRITHPDGGFFTYDYDAAGRLTGIDQLGNSDVLSLYYNASGERYVLGRGLTASAWLHDPLGRMTYEVHDLAGDSSDVNWTFGRNPASGIASQTRSNDAYAWTGHYGVARAYATNGLNQYSGTTSTLGNASFTYDLNGNLITTPGPNGQTITYTYDVENRLVAASGGVQLGYDPLGRLAWTTGSPNFTSFLYDGDALVAEYDYGGAVTERYVHGPGADEPWLWYHGAAVDHSSLRLPFADQQGSIVANSTYLGVIININRYDEYGIPAATNTGRFQYTGQTWLGELGMYYYKARIYSPTLGRFLQADPVGYAGGINLYAYVGSDPVNRTDPSGLWVCANAQSRVQCGVVSAGLAQLRDARQYMSGAILKQTNAILDAYGGDGVNNGVQVTVGGRLPMTTSTRDGITTITVSARVTSLSYLERRTGSSAAGVIAHEGDHIINERQRLGGRDPRTRQEWYNSERRGYTIQGLVDRALGFRGFGPTGGANPLWQESWRGTSDAVARMTHAARNRAEASQDYCPACTGPYYAW